MMTEKAKNNNLRRAIAIGAALYIFGLHIIVAVVLFNPVAVDNQRWRLGAMQRPTEHLSYTLAPYFKALDQQSRSGRTVIIGDSHCHRYDTTKLATGIMNFCAGGDTLANISHRIGEYRSVEHADTLIIWAGTNDFLHKSISLVDFEAVIRATLKTPTTANEVLVLSLPPLGAEIGQKGMRERFQKANSALQENCIDRCTFIDLAPILAADDGILKGEFDAGDGIHLNSAGYCAVTLALKPYVKAASC